MSLTKTTTIDSINIVGEFKTIFVKEVTKITDGQELIAEKNHRYSYQPDTDISILPEEVQAVANLVWTQEVKDAFQASLPVVEEPVVEEEV